MSTLTQKPLDPRLNKDIITHAQKIKSNLPTLGTLTWWGINQVMVHKDELAKMLKKYELEKMLPNDPSHSTAFNRSIKAIKQSNILIRKTVDNQEMLSYAFVNENLLSGSDPSYDVTNSVTLFKNNNSLELRYPDRFPFEETINASYLENQNFFNSLDIRNILLKTIKEDFYGLGIRPNGGIYFTHRQYDETLDRIESLIQNLNNDSLFFTLGIIDSERTRMNMFSIMEAELSSELDTLVKELDVLLLPDKQTKETTLARKLHQIDDVSSRARMYERLLELKAGSIHQRIAQIENRTKNAILGAKAFL